MPNTVQINNIRAKTATRQLEDETINVKIKTILFETKTGDNEKF